MKPVQIQELTFIALNNEIQSVEVSKRANGMKIIETNKQSHPLDYFLLFEELQIQQML